MNRLIRSANDRLKLRIPEKYLEHNETKINIVHDIVSEKVKAEVDRIKMNTKEKF